MAKYKLLAGKHIQRNKITGKSELFLKGSVIESDYDLNKLNAGLGPLKFERLPDDYKGNTTDSHLANSSSAATSTLNVAMNAQDLNKLMTKLEAMSVKDLQAFAAEEEIDIKGSSKKEDILKFIKQSLM